MHRRIVIVILMLIILSPSLLSQKTTYIKKSIQVNTNQSSFNQNEWYYLPGFSNYAPMGLPDFDQRQDETWRTWFSWSFCGPTALADIIWWFDSKHENVEGHPGDGSDLYPLVQNYNPPGNPLPGPMIDDHNFNNVNDLGTSWTQYSQSGELIERLATYVDIYWFKIPFITISGTDRYQLAWGTKQWIKDAGLKERYTIENILRPSFQLISERLHKNQGIILRLGYYFPPSPVILFPLIFVHYVAVAGIHPDGYIAISDPEWDIVNPCTDPTLHNDPQYVSHDTYQVDFSSPCPSLSSWWIPSFERHRCVLVIAAIIISEHETK